MEKEVEIVGSKFAKLKFEKSKESNLFVAFVHEKGKNLLHGVRKDDKLHKKICLVDKRLEDNIVPKVLYTCELVPMKSKKGYVVVKASPLLFETTVTSTYKKGMIYQVEVSFGMKNIIFDPKDGIRRSERTISGCVEMLEKRFDIRNKDLVIEDFVEKAVGILKLYEKDGCAIRKKKTQVA